MISIWWFVSNLESLITSFLVLTLIHCRSLWCSSTNYVFDKFWKERFLFKSYPHWKLITSENVFFKIWVEIFYFAWEGHALLLRYAVSFLLNISINFENFEAMTSIRTWGKYNFKNSLWNLNYLVMKFDKLIRMSKDFRKNCFKFRMRGS